MLDADIRQRVLDALASGRLWPLKTDTMLAGSGSGNACFICDERISDREIEYTVPTPGGVVNLRFHLACCEMWRKLSV